MAKIKNERNFECPICGIFIKNKKANLLRHINLHQGEQYRKKCALCNKTFQTKGNLIIHLKNIHSMSNSEQLKQLGPIEIVLEPAKRLRSVFAVNAIPVFGQNSTAADSVIASCASVLNIKLDETAINIDDWELFNENPSFGWMDWEDFEKKRIFSCPNVQPVQQSLNTEEMNKKPYRLANYIDLQIDSGKEGKQQENSKAPKLTPFKKDYSKIPGSNKWTRSTDGDDDDDDGGSVSLVKPKVKTSTLFSFSPNRDHRSKLMPSLPLGNVSKKSIVVILSSTPSPPYANLSSNTFVTFCTATTASVLSVQFNATKTSTIEVKAPNKAKKYSSVRERSVVHGQTFGSIESNCSSSTAKRTKQMVQRSKKKKTNRKLHFKLVPLVPLQKNKVLKRLGRAKGVVPATERVTNVVPPIITERIKTDTAGDVIQETGCIGAIYTGYD